MFGDYGSDHDCGLSDRELLITAESVLRKIIASEYSGPIIRWSEDLGLTRNEYRYLRDLLDT